MILSPPEALELLSKDKCEVWKKEAREEEEERQEWKFLILTLRNGREFTLQPRRRPELRDQAI